MDNNMSARGGSASGEKKFIIVLVVLVVVGVGAYYLVSNKGSSGTPTNTPTPTSSLNTNTPEPTMQTSMPTATITPTATPKASVSKTLTPLSVSVSIANFTFSPATLSIKKGTKITWVNNDSAPHTVTSDSGNLLNSPTLAPGQSYSVTLTNVGTVKYHCAIHPMMKGNIVVTN